MIIIAGTIDLDDESGRDALVVASAPLQQATRDEEPGCLSYCFAADPVDGRRIQIYELWADQGSLAAHFEHPNYRNMRAVLNGAKPRAVSTAKYRCDLTEPVYDDSRAPRADFFTA